MAAPTFDTIPVIQDRSGMRFGAATISGVSTRHGSNDTDNGRLYGRIVCNTDRSIRVDLFSDFQRARLFAFGTGTANDDAIPIAGGVGSQAAGEVTILNPNEGVTDAILIVSLSVDADCLADSGRCAEMPGYDPDYGLAHFQSRATKQILLTDLPAAIPYTFQAPRVSAFIPLGRNVEFPDLTKIESAESLRGAAAMLALSMSADEAVYLDEFARMGTALRSRFATLMAQVKAANMPAETVAGKEETGTVQFSKWRRG